MVTLRTQADLARYAPGATLEEGRSYALVALGEQPAGTAVEGLCVIEQDRFGWDVLLRVDASMPYAAKETVRPFAVVSFAGRPMRIEHTVRVTLRMGDVTFDAMDLERAEGTRAKLGQMSRKQRSQVRALHDANLALRAELARREREVLAYDQDPAFEAALSALDFRARLHFAVEVAALKTDLELFGTTANPMVSSGDESLRYLSKNTKQWSAELAEDYGTEAEYLRKAIAKLDGQLASMRALAAKHAPAAQETPRAGVAQAVER